MEHIWILVYFISIAIGLLAAFYSFHLYTAWRYPFLRDIGNYTVVFNLVMVLYLIVKYASANLPGPAAKDHHSSFYTIMVLAATLGEIGLITTFFRVRSALLDKSVSRVVNTLFAVGLVLVGVSCAVGIAVYSLRGSNGWIMTTYIVVASIGITVLPLISMQLVIGPNTGRKDDRRPAVRSFGILYLIGFLVFFGTASIPRAYQLFPGSTAVLYLNFIPIIWLKRYFFRYYVQRSSEQNAKLLESLGQIFHISNRECEIIRLILEGKTNKEIKDLLFISYNTVKNHIYNIYQKLGVNSRSQMIYSVLQVQRKSENPSGKSESRVSEGSSS